MGKYVNNRKVDLGSYGSPIDDDTARQEIALLLGVGKRSDGKYYHADICQARSINPYARFKPERSTKNANLTEADRVANSFGFGETPRIEPQNTGIPHAVYEYKRPRGSAASPVEWNRIRDFHGYNHLAVNPIQFFFPEKLMREEMNVAYLMANSTGQSGWNATDCVSLHDIVDSTTKGYNVGLLIHRGSSLWLMPTNVKISDLSTSVFPIVRFAKDSSTLDGTASANVFDYVFEDLSSGEGETYTMAFVATSLGYQSDMLPVTHTEGIPTMRSLEVTMGSDRTSLVCQSNQLITGITGAITTENWAYTVAADPEGSETFSIVKPDADQKLSISVTTPESWKRSTVYLETVITNTTGFIYHNGEKLDLPVVILGKGIRIGANQTIAEDILTHWSYPNQYWFQFPKTNRKCTIQIKLMAYRSSYQKEDGIELDMKMIDFPEK